VSTTYAPHAHVRRPHGVLWLGVGIGLLAILIGLASWAVYEQVTGPEQTATQLMDDATVAWTAPTMGAFADVYTDDAVVVLADGTELFGVEAIHGAAARLAPVSFAAERVAPVTVEGDYATTFVHWTSRVEEGTQAQIARLEDGRIAELAVIELGPGFPRELAR